MTAAKAARARALPSRTRQDAARPGPGITQGAAVRPMKPALAARRRLKTEQGVMATFVLLSEMEKLR